jgi:hypothetical protein
MTPNDLLKVNVNDHTEKKNGLTYLSWAWAWAKVLEVDPSANYEVKFFKHTAGMELPYMDLGGSCFVWVTVYVFGKSMTVQLPVLDYRNKCIPAPNAFDINTSIMRCLVKGIAMHGLGLYIYAGEDLPMQDTPEPVKIIAVDDSGKPKAEFEVQTKSQRANDELFSEAMIEYSTLVKDLKDLNSYWKANQATLDNLKVTSPDLYAKVRDTFSTLKATFSKE